MFPDTIPIPEAALPAVNVPATPKPHGPEPLLVPAKQAGPVCGVSAATWWRMHAGGLCPAPVKVSSRTLWRMEELRRWIEAACPNRRTWEAQERSRKERSR